MKRAYRSAHIPTLLEYHCQCQEVKQKANNFERMFFSFCCDRAENIRGIEWLGNAIASNLTNLVFFRKILV
ncbi:MULTISPECIES: hypothetical protein [Spirulina sp. CCY15215]|uniref:hypothetical protein n=1 Tax=Spirulina sp. CCY15215 TaxID=2767591 RepID=UPI00194F28DC|nr:hypothetical protein [Spirulina major]